MTYRIIVLTILGTWLGSCISSLAQPEDASQLNQEYNVNVLLNSYKDIFILDNPYFLAYHPEAITKTQVSIIYFILQHADESFSHQMRGAKGNMVYVSEDGREVVFDNNGDLVTNYNAGTYNFASITEKPVKHFIVDRLPWVLMGNSPADITYSRERFWAYLQELNMSIQSYIFSEDNTSVSEHTLAEFKGEEVTAIRYFHFLLFQSDYAIQLSLENLERLQDSKEFYYRYFEQVLLTALHDRKPVDS